MSNTYEFVMPASFAGSARASSPSKKSLAATAASLLPSSVGDATVPTRPTPRRTGGGGERRAGLAGQVTLDQEKRELVLRSGECAAVRLESLLRRVVCAQSLPFDHDFRDLVDEHLDRAGRTGFHFAQRKAPPRQKRYDGRLVLSPRGARFLGSIAPRYAGRDQGAGRLRPPCKRRPGPPAGRCSPQ